MSESLSAGYMKWISENTILSYICIIYISIIYTIFCVIYRIYIVQNSWALAAICINFEWECKGQKKSKNNHSSNVCLSIYILYIYRHMLHSHICTLNFCFCFYLFVAMYVQYANWLFLSTSVDNEISHVWII